MGAKNVPIWSLRIPRMDYPLKELLLSAVVKGFKNTSPLLYGWAVGKNIKITIFNGIKKVFGNMDKN